MLCMLCEISFFYYFVRVQGNKMMEFISNISEPPNYPVWSLFLRHSAVISTETFIAVGSSL